MVKSYIFLIIFAIFSRHPVFAVENLEESDLLFAKKALSDGFYGLAEERFENFLESYPRTSRLYEAHLLLGQCLYYQNNPRKALLEMEFVLDNPGEARFQDAALYWIGEVYFKTGDFAKAFEFYQKVIDNFPSSKYISYAVY